MKLAGVGDRRLLALRQRRDKNPKKGRGQGEAETGEGPVGEAVPGEGPVDLHPTERPSHGRLGAGATAKQELRSAWIARLERACHGRQAPAF